jgi:hypothetical protein
MYQTRAPTVMFTVTTVEATVSVTWKVKESAPVNPAAGT